MFRIPVHWLRHLILQKRLRALGSGSFGSRGRAADKLGNSADRRAVEPLIVALQDEYCSVRRAAAAALGKIGDVRAIMPLIESLEDKDSEVKKLAAVALSSLWSRKNLVAAAIPILTKAMTDPRPFVREAAAAIFEKIAPELFKLQHLDVLVR